jgi:hypothetical protein
MITYPPLEMEVLPRKIPLPASPQTEGEAIRVQGYHLDNYGHMNNARYVDIASACLPDGFQARRMRAEYKRAAFPGDLIIPRCARSGDDAFTVSLSARHPAGSSAEHPPKLSAEDLFTVMEFSGA